MRSYSCWWHLHSCAYETQVPKASLVLKHKSSKQACLQPQTWYTAAKMAGIWGEPGLCGETLHRKKKKKKKDSDYLILIDGSASYIAHEGFKGT